MTLVCKLYWMVNISSALVQMLFITWDQVSWTLLPRERKLPYLIMMMYRKYRLCWNLKWIRHFMMKGLLHHYQWVEWNNSWNWHVSRELWRLLVEWWSLQICKSAILLHVSTYFCFIEDICCTQFKKKKIQTNTKIKHLLGNLLSQVCVNNNVRNIIKLVSYLPIHPLMNKKSEFL